jgi:hypothetical protein
MYPEGLLKSSGYCGFESDGLLSLMGCVWEGNKLGIDNFFLFCCSGCLKLFPCWKTHFSSAWKKLQCILFFFHMKIDASRHHSVSYTDIYLSCSLHRHIPWSCNTVHRYYSTFMMCIYSPPSWCVDIHMNISAYFGVQKPSYIKKEM